MPTYRTQGKRSLNFLSAGRGQAGSRDPPAMEEVSAGDDPAREGPKGGDSARELAGGGEGEIEDSPSHPRHLAQASTRALGCRSQ